MKSTKITKWLIGLVCVAGLSSCDITLYPEDTITPDSYFRNETDLELFTNSLYTSLPGTEIYEDEADIIINMIIDDRIAGTRVVPQSGGGWSWGTLRHINYFLENAQRCEDKEALKHYNGLARFFRAYFYYDKVRKFGDVPWYDEVIGSADEDLLHKPQDSRVYVMDRVLDDLDFAIANLRSDAGSVYRINKWAALALKSRIMLFEGTFRKYHKLGNWKECLEECVKASEQLMNESGYKLHSSYTALFTTLDANQTKDEVILARNYSYPLLSHGVQGYVNAPGAGSGGVTKRLADAYLMKNGTRHTERAGYQTMDFVTECKDRDPRMAATLRTPGFKKDGAACVPDLKVANTGYHLCKYEMGKKYESYSEVDLSVFRLGEVYLNFAEAKAELGTLSQKDLDNSINLLRKRAGVTGNLNMADANAKPCGWMKSNYPNLVENAAEYGNDENLGVILEIRRERTVEFVMEGLRYWDIMRWKEGKVFEEPFLGFYIPEAGQYDLDGNGSVDYTFTSDSYNGATVGTVLKLGTNLTVTDGDHGNLVLHGQFKRTWDEDRDYYYPIPIKERVLTNGKLRQNPGWNDGLSF